MSNFWLNYWWPSIKGNGPEDVTSLLIVAILTAVLVPVVRRAIERFAQRHVASIKAHAENLHAETRQHAEDLHATLHARMDKLEGKPPTKPRKT